MSQDTFEQDRSDAIDAIVEEWTRERPELDARAKHVTGRVVRLASLFERSYAAAFDAVGVGEGDYGVLATLRRAGEPFQLAPTDLAHRRMMTSGGMTAAIDRLARRGLVERHSNPADRRGSFVRLTAEGRRLADAAMTVHVEVEQDLVKALTERERGQLERLLRKLLLSVDPTA